jgi:xanthine dehydrogenase accessory factor
VAEAELSRVHKFAASTWSTDHREIAVAVLADLVARRAAGELRVPISASEPPPEQAVDPVCGMTVDVAGARWTTERDGQTWYFCSPGCLEAFLAEQAARPPG